MKRFVVVFISICLLFGCGNENREDHQAIEIRKTLQTAKGCSFDSRITADYGDSVCVFDLNCIFDNAGNLTFTALQPDTISGITGTVSNEGGHLTFDDNLLLFDLLLDEQLTPVCAPWLLYKTLIGGVIKGVDNDVDGNCVIYADVFSGETFDLYAWFQADGKPESCEIVWLGRRILTIEISNFTIL